MYSNTVADWRKALYERGDLETIRVDGGRYTTVGGVKEFADLYNYLAANHVEIQKSLDTSK